MKPTIPSESPFAQEELFPRIDPDNLEQIQEAADKFASFVQQRVAEFNQPDRKFARHVETASFYIREALNALDPKSEDARYFLEAALDEIEAMDRS